MSIRNRVQLACALLLIAYAIGSVRYAGVWQNELTLWTAAVAHAPNKPRPHISWRWRSWSADNSRTRRSSWMISIGF
jgi:hypothetical protein